MPIVYTCLDEIRTGTGIFGWLSASIAVVSDASELAVRIGWGYVVGVVVTMPVAGMTALRTSTISQLFV